MMLQKPLKCRNANCGAMCSPANAEMWSDNPEKCPNYKRDNHSEIKEIRAEIKHLLNRPSLTHVVGYDKGFVDGIDKVLQIIDRRIEGQTEKEFIPIRCITCKHDIGDRNNPMCLDCVNHNKWEYFKTR